MSDAPKPGDARPFIIISLACCIACYPVLLVLQLWASDERPPWPELFYRPAVVLACCWVLYSVTLSISFRLWWLRDKSEDAVNSRANSSR
jgi:hypothetical protein